jgi:ethanolamine ammonia-lyase large subunit
VNDVAGFIGPEVFQTADQLERVCLEDVVMAKLHGLTMGLDVCATFHMGIAPSELRAVTKRVVERAAPAYLMAVAGNADPMLGYMTTSFREHPGAEAPRRAADDVADGPALRRTWRRGSGVPAADGRALERALREGRRQPPLSPNARGRRSAAAARAAGAGARSRHR